jgi:hypothetical protein
MPVRSSSLERLSWCVCFAVAAGCAVGCATDANDAQPFKVDASDPSGATAVDSGTERDAAVGSTSGDPTAAGDPATPEGCPVDPPTTCPDDVPHYADVAPLFAQHCLSCHDGVNGHPWSLGTYEPVADWSGEVRAALISCAMPPPESRLTMPLEDRMTILNWIRCGFPQ